VRARVRPALPHARGTGDRRGSTKAFTTQLAALVLLTMTLARCEAGCRRSASGAAALARHLPRALERVLARRAAGEDVVRRSSPSSSTPCSWGRDPLPDRDGRGAEAEKRISYIHAEAYAAGELKARPLALVDKNMPVIANCAKDALLEKLKSNLQEVRARAASCTCSPTRTRAWWRATASTSSEMPDHAGFPGLDPAYRALCSCSPTTRSWSGANERGQAQESRQIGDRE